MTAPLATTTPTSTEPPTTATPTTEVPSTWNTSSCGSPLLHRRPRWERHDAVYGRRCRPCADRRGLHGEVSGRYRVRVGVGVADREPRAPGGPTGQPWRSSTGDRRDLPVDAWPTSWRAHEDPAPRVGRASSYTQEFVPTAVPTRVPGHPYLGTATGRRRRFRGGGTTSVRRWLSSLPIRFHDRSTRRSSPPSRPCGTDLQSQVPGGRPPNGWQSWRRPEGR